MIVRLSLMASIAPRLEAEESQIRLEVYRYVMDFDQTTPPSTIAPLPCLHKLPMPRL